MLGAASVAACFHAVSRGFGGRFDDRVPALRHFQPAHEQVLRFLRRAAACFRRRCTTPDVPRTGRSAPTRRTPGLGTAAWTTARRASAGLRTTSRRATSGLRTTSGRPSSGLWTSARCTGPRVRSAGCSHARRPSGLGCSSRATARAFAVRTSPGGARIWAAPRASCTARLRRAARWPARLGSTPRRTAAWPARGSSRRRPASRGGLRARERALPRGLSRGAESVRCDDGARPGGSATDHRPAWSSPRCAAPGWAGADGGSTTSWAAAGCFRRSSAWRRPARSRVERPGRVRGHGAAANC